MTATTGTTGTTGPRPLFKAYDEAVEKNGWRKDGLTEKAVFALALAKMMDAWSQWRYCQTVPGFSLGEFFGWLHFGDGVKLKIAVARAGVVYMTDRIGPIKRYDGRKLQLLEEHLEGSAFWVVGECARGGYQWPTTEACIKRLSLGAGCDDEGWLKTMELSATPMRIPMEVVQMEYTEKLLADLKTMVGDKA